MSIETQEILGLNTQMYCHLKEAIRLRGEGASDNIVIEQYRLANEKAVAIVTTHSRLETQTTISDISEGALIK